MSDIFIKAADGTWKKASNIFIRLAGGVWQAAASIFLKISSVDWIKVWPLSGIFSTRSPWIGPNSDTAYADRLTTSSRIRIGSNYYGNNAQWNLNGWTVSSYTYAWKYYDEFNNSLGTLDSGTGSGWTSGGTGQDLLPTTIWTSTVSSNTDRQYLGFEVTANATNSAYSGTAVSSRIQIIRRIPVNITTALSSYNPVVGTQITYSSTWDTSEARKAESFRTTIIWYRNSTNVTSGGIQVGTGSTYTPTSSDIGNYLYVIETRFNSGTDYDLGLNTGVSASIITNSTVVDQSFQFTGSQRRITLPSNFTSGTTLYISTNGYVNWGGSDPGGSISIPTSGITLSPLNADLRQGQSLGNGTNISTGGLWTYADASNFYVRWEGNYYQDATQTAEYQIKFYWNQAYADVYFIENNLTSVIPSTTAVQNGSNVFRTWSQSTSQSSSLISTGIMTRNSTQDGQDDQRTAIVANLPVAPSGGSALLTNAAGTTISSITSGGVIYFTKVDASGSPTPTSSWVWQRNDGGTGGNQFRTVQFGGTTYITGSSDVGYSIRAVVTWTNGVSPDQVVNSNTVSVTSAISVSNVTRSDNTPTPSQPSTISFSSSNNFVTSTWTNGSPITSVTYTYSGAGTSGSLTDTVAPFVTSDVTAYSQSGTYTFTVTNFNNSFEILVVWDQVGAQSYRIDYVSSTQGSGSSTGNNSGSTIGVTIPWSSAQGSFTLTGVTVYSGTNQSGSSAFASGPSGSITPTVKSSSRSNSTFLTYTSPNLTAPTITSVSAPSTPGGSLSVFFSGGSGPFYQIWWQGSSDFSSVTSYDANGSSSPVTDTTGPSSGTWWVAVRSVSSLTNTGSGPSSTISAWSTPVQFTVAAGTAPSAPGTPTIAYNGFVSGAYRWTVSWTQVSGATDYDVEGQFNTTASATGATISTYTGVGNISSYQISHPTSFWARARVRAKNAFGTSAYSSYSSWA